MRAALLLLFTSAAYGLRLQMSAPRGGTWLPIASISGLGEDLPRGIEVCGEKLVVWRGKDSTLQSFSVMPDVCSHRHAPLSEGRVDENGCLECPYHGLTFNTQGTCTKIPQLESNRAIPVANNIVSYPTKVVGDMLFAQISSLPSLTEYPKSPEVLFPLLANITTYVTRDLPYNMDFLLENFLDPSHIPFAHHGLQGVRADGAPLPMSVVQEDASGVEVAYSDKIRGKPRDGVVSFQPPCYYHFRVKQPDASWKIPLFVLCVPIKPGWCRVHLTLPALKLPKFIPRWISHSFTNRFLDSDIWIHDQENVGAGLGNSFLPHMSQKVKPYVMPTQSDLGVKTFRSWYEKHLQSDPIFGKQRPISITKAEQLDRLKNHAAHCTACRSARSRAFTIKKFAPLVTLLAVAVAPRVWLRLAAVALFAATEWACGRVIRSIEGPVWGERSSVAKV